MALLGKRLSSHHGSSNHGDGELWLISYADMMTLLLGFFVILYTLSTPDEQKMQAVSKQLSEAFNGEKKEDQQKSEVGMQLEARHLRALQLLVAMLNLGDNLEDAIGKIEKKAAEAKGMAAAKEAIMDELKQKDDGTLAQLKMAAQSNTDSIDIALPDSMLFESGTADLTPRAKVGLRKIADSLNKVKGLVGIEIAGHTDSLPPSKYGKFTSNWALSAARAGAVAEELLKNGVEPKSLTPRGMASLQPLFPEKREDGSLIVENLPKNRRVQITVKKVRYGEGK